MQIYIHRNNQQLGPFTEAEIKAQLASGAISLQDHVWWQGQEGWVPLGQSPLAASLASTTPGSAPKMPNPLPATPGVSYIPPTGGQTSQLAIWALVCGCLSVLCWPFTSIPAIILGHMGLAEIKKNPALQGRGMALAGMILGYVFTALVVLYFVCVVLVFSAVSSQVKETFKTIDAQLKAEQATHSADQSATSPDLTTNAPDQTPAPAPTTTNSPDQSTNSAPATTNSADSSTNAPDSTTNAAPMNQ